MLFALTLLLLCQLAGEVAVRAIDAPVPGPVLGLVLLFGLIAVRGGPPGELGPVAQTLLRHLSLLFIPAGVGILIHLARIGEEWLAILLALAASTLATLLVTALVFALVSRWQDTSR